MILVDTSVWVDFFRGSESKHREALRGLIESDQDVAITEIILTEILQGIRRDGEFETLKEYLMEFPVVKPKGVETYLDAARIYRTCRKKGKTVRKTVDCVIAAICIENRIPLLHKNSDFTQIAACSVLKIFKA